MKARLFYILTLLVLLAGLLPTTAAFADGGNDGNYEFRGTIETLPADIYNGDWQVSGVTVHVTPATQIDEERGPVAVGAYVEVKGWLQADGSVDATKIDVKSSPGGGGGGGDDHGYMKFYGTIESLPDTPGWIGDWIVSGRTVHVTSATQIEQEHGPVAMYAFVEVKGPQQADGSVNATKIEVKIGAGSGGNGRSYTQFYGTIDSMPANGLTGDWSVGGRTVHVDAATRIEQEHGPVAVGVYVEVKGWLEADDSVSAVKIEVKEGQSSGSGGSGGGSIVGTYTKFYGTVDNYPDGLVGLWSVSGQSVEVTPTTWIDQEHGPVTQGAYVEVEGWVQTDGTVTATKIEVKDSPGNYGDGSHTKFYGTVEQLPADGLVGTWWVSGRAVQVDSSTWINQEHGTVMVGAYIEVEGMPQTDGSIIATKIEVKSHSATGGGSSGSEGYTKFYGIVESLPAGGSLIGDWVVSGRTVHVDAITRIDQEHGPVQTGVRVEVKGIQNADGTVTAYKIEVKY
ncbi:MAG: hypothetical protein D6791_16100 [Chloroflexi bacterium]|nr:MAG: hypothetical protein D6791_16100 [Chloroflexota bacterium]